MDTTKKGRVTARPNRTGRSLLAIGLLTAAATLWFITTQRGTDVAAADAPVKDANPVLELAAEDVASVELASLNRTLPITGSLSPLVQTVLKAQVPGELLEVKVREGQSVLEGDVLARVDTRNLRAQFDSQQAALEKARADLALAKLNRDNSAVMLKRQFISQNAFDTADSTYQANVASVKVAEAQLSLARIAMDYAVVRAPFGGTIAQRLVQPGEKVEVGSSLLTLVDLSHLELQAAAPDYEVPSIRTGQVARFRVNGFGDRLFEGRVERINPMTDTGSRSIMIYLAVDNPDGVLKGGMFAQGELVLDDSGPVKSIPLTAVRTQAGMPYVLAIEGTKLSRRPVVLGLRSEEQNQVEVREGLAAGDRVVFARIESLSEGASVVVSGSATPSLAAENP